jgi:hypothetical protein
MARDMGCFLRIMTVNADVMFAGVARLGWLFIVPAGRVMGKKVLMGQISWREEVASLMPLCKIRLYILCQVRRK